MGLSLYVLLLMQENQLFVVVFLLYLFVHDFLCFLILVIIFDFFPYVEMMS